MKKIFDNKILVTISSVVEWILCIFLLLLVLITLNQRFSKGGDFFGYRIYTVASSSMIPDYEIGDTVLVKEVEIDKIDVGDAVTYKGEDITVKDMIITHRVEKIKKLNDEYVFHTKGIANNIEDPLVYEHQILGKVIHKFAILSFIGSISTNLYKLFFFVTVPLAVLIVIEIIKITKEKDDDEVEE